MPPVFRNFRLSLVLVFVVAFTGAVFGKSSAFPGPWPLTPSGEAPASGSVWGTLPNGLRYVVLPSVEAGESASLRLLVAAGRGHENKGEKGAALLAAHLMDRGTRGFSQDVIFGMKAASGTASTKQPLGEVEIDHVVYRMDFLRAGADALSLGIGLFAEIAGDVDFDSKTVEREAAILAAEIEYGSVAVELRRLLREQSVYRGGAFSGFDDQGLTASLKGLTASQVETFWRRNYRADRMVLVVTGGVDAAVAQSQIEEAFSPLAASDEPKPFRGEPGKSRSLGDVTTLPRGNFSVGVTYGRVLEGGSLFEPSKEEAFYKKDFIGRYAKYLALQTAEMEGSPMVKRLDEIAFILRSYEGGSNFPDRVISMDKVVLLLGRDGIREDYFDLAKSEYLNLLRSDDSLLGARRDAVSLADRLVASAVDAIPFRHGERLERFVTRLVEGLSLNEAKGICEQLFSVKKMSIVMELPIGMKTSGRAFEKQFKATRKDYNYGWLRLDDDKPVNTLAPQGQQEGIVELTNLLAFGEYSLLQYEFGNSVRMNLVRSDAEPGQVQMTFVMGNGLSALKNPNPAFASLVSRMVADSKIGQGLNRDSLRASLEHLGLRNIEIGLDLEGMKWSVTGRKVEDAESFLTSLIYWLATGFDTEEDFDSKVKRLKEEAEAREKTRGSLQALQEAVYAGEPRKRRFFDSEDVEALSFEDYYAWINELRSNSYIEFTVVGDVSPRALMRSMRRTFGAAPRREGKVLQPRHAAEMQWPDAGATESQFETRLSKGYVLASYPLGEPLSCEDDLRAEALLVLYRDFLEKNLEDEPEWLASLELEVIQEAMIPGSRALVVRTRTEKDKLDAARDRFAALGQQFAAELTQERLDAVLRGVWLKLLDLPRRGKEMSTFVSMSQGRPNRLRCVLSLIENPYTEKLDSFAAFASESLSVDNLRSTVLRPK